MAVLDTMPAVARRAGTGAMTDRVREILSCYESDSAGTKTNLARLLTHGYLAGTGKLVKADGTEWQIRLDFKSGSNK